MARLAATAVLLAATGCSAPAVPPQSVAPSTAAGQPSESASACPAATTPEVHDWSSRVWYEVFVRSFADGDGDGIGDFAGLTQKLDYLNDGDPATTDDLGVTGIWLMPIAESPSYHGYDVVDYEAVETDYGTREDLDGFLAEAHARGIEVIVDLVMNHSSAEHPWFLDSAAGTGHEDWYTWADEDPGWLGPDNQIVWHERDGRWYYALFWEGMPDLNLRSPEVTAELEAITRFWLEDVGVDGFRIDGARHLIEAAPDAQVNTPETLAWLADWTATVDTIDPDATTVGEVYDAAVAAGPYVPASADLTFDFGLARAMTDSLAGGDAWQIGQALDDSIESWPANRNATFLTNHDQTRVMTRLGGDIAAAKLGAFLLLTVPGTPFLYYGEEIGLPGDKPDERIRTPMPWTGDGPGAGFTTGTPWEPLEDGWESVNVAAQTGDPDSLLSTYRDLIAVRAASPILQQGGASVVDTGADEVASWLRTSADGTLLAVVNASDEPVSEYALSLDAGPLCGDMVATILAEVGDDGAATAGPLTATADGGLDGWVPFPALPPQSGYLLSVAAP